MRYTGVLLLLTALCFVSCTGKKDFKDGIVQLQSRPVSLSLDKMRCMWNGKDTVVSEERYDTDFKLVVYSDTAACSSCGLKTMYLWDDLIHALESYGKSVSLCFIFMPLQKDLEEFYFTMRTMAPLLPVHVDTAGIFIRENPHIPREAVYHTFLLDKDNRVVLVGNPSRSEKIKEMFWQIVEEKLGKRE